jgi:hypothetical protein
MPAVMPPTVPQQYVMPSTAPYATPYTAAPAMAAPTMGAPAQMPYAYYGEPGCSYAGEPSCGYMGTVGYGPSFPMEMSGSCCEAGAYDAGAAPATGGESFIDPTPAAE